MRNEKCEKAYAIMVRLIIFFVSIAVIASGLSWIADRPGTLVIDWQGRRVEMEIFHAFVALAILVGTMIFLWSLLRQIIKSPTMITDAFKRRTQRRGLEAISTGIIAVGAGDRELASRFSTQARKSLPNEPLVALLRAQTAQLNGDNATARRIYESMLAAPDTELLGLRGLFLEARNEGEAEAAGQFAQRAQRINPNLDWPVAARFDLQCRSGDWVGALESVADARKYGHIDKDTANRRRAVLLAACALEAEADDMDTALDQALEAHKLAPDLVPAADVAGRILASRGNTARAASVVAKTWKLSPHPDLATTYAFARPGDSPGDRMKRINDLVASTPHSIEAPIAVAAAAIDTKDWDTARAALKPLLEDKLTKKICALMARIEGEQNGDKGRVREWLARAVHAPLDATWVTEDGIVSTTWLPAAPATGELDVFKWNVPDEKAARDGSNLLEEWMRPLAISDAQDDPVEVDAEMITIEADLDPVIEAEPVETVSPKVVPLAKKGNGHDAVNPPRAPDDPGSPDTGASRPGRRRPHLPHG
ncbi:MAG: heme biosynthesis protein HemY [Hyphomicrobiaceae bacterium]